MAKLTGKNKERARQETRQHLHIVHKTTDNTASHEDPDIELASTPHFSPFMKTMARWMLVPIGIFLLLSIVGVISRL